MQNLNYEKFHEIAYLFFENIANELYEEQSNLGLFAGKFGELLFLAHYLRDEPGNHYQILFDRYSENCFDSLVRNIQYHTYCNGLAGILPTLRYLDSHGLLRVDYSELELYYEDYLYRQMCKELSVGNIDFLHGALGIALCFQNNPKFVLTVVEALEETAIIDGDKYKWAMSLGVDKGKGYNVSLSHGLAGIILILVRFYHNGLYADRIGKLIEGAVNYILSQEIDCIKYGGFFPSQSLENEEVEVRRSRLAWCYGDLGVGVALWKAGRLLNRNTWRSKGLEVLKFSTTRRDLLENYVIDACLCHGSSGIAMIFKHMYNETMDRCFIEAHSYWIDVTLKMAKFNDGLAGYKSFKDAEGDPWENNSTFLEGIAGIGMILWSADKCCADTQWTDLFLI